MGLMMGFYVIRTTRKIDRGQMLFEVLIQVSLQVSLRQYRFSNDCSWILVTLKRHGLIIGLARFCFYCLQITTVSTLTGLLLVIGYLYLDLYSQSESASSRVH